MSRTRLAALTLAASALVASGCGESTKSSGQKPASSFKSPAGGESKTASESSTPTGPLTRVQLIASGDSICYRANAKRASISIGRRQDYERFMPELSAYELAAAAEMRKLTPPPSMAASWRQMVEGAQTIGEVTGHARTFAQANNQKEARSLDIALGKAIDEVVSAAKREGFKDCARFA